MQQVNSLLSLQAIIAAVDASNKDDYQVQIQILQDMRSSIAKLSEAFEDKTEGTGIVLQQLTAMLEILQTSLAELSVKQPPAIPVRDVSINTLMEDQMPPATITSATTTPFAHPAVMLLSSVITGVVATDVTQRACSRRVGASGQDVWVSRTLRIQWVYMV